MTEPAASDVVARTERFADEVRRYGLRFRCPDCVHVAPTTLKCSLGLPNARFLAHDGGLDAAGELVFCKYYELLA
ncbi:MAG: hypothetical protein U1F43_38205 [Myxococcota bacterium]